MSPLARFETANWTLVPHHLHHPLERWLCDGIEPDRSAFLRELLKGSVKGSLAAAGILERRKFFDLVDFLNWHCPPQCWGSPADYETWKAIHGWRGMRDTEVRYD
jgi:hypothetical protein